MRRRKENNRGYLLGKKSKKGMNNRGRYDEIWCIDAIFSSSLFCFHISNSNLAPLKDFVCKSLKYNHFIVQVEKLLSSVIQIDD